MSTDLTTLYGKLRAGLLSRHFALGRHFRADHLSFSNNLGVVHQAGGTTDDTQNDLVHGCLWSGAEVTQPTTVYKKAADLLALSPVAALFERWRVGDHSRTNPLMYTGQLMVCLAVESVLGIPGSQGILGRLLATTKSLFKFGTPPYNGYIVRWDAATSDHWTTFLGEGAVWVDHCCDFLIDSDTPNGYLYCTPLDDPRYTPYMTQSDFDKLTNSEMIAYQKARGLSLDELRYWEPSMDELVGLLAGYNFVFAVVSDPSIQAAVSDQVQWLGAYLSANAYLLVRPNGGFGSQGASGAAPALEFPFGRVFSRVTGSDCASETNFEGALQNAKLWSEFASAFFWATVGGILAGVALLILLSLLGLVLGGVLGAIIAGVGTVVLLKALVVYLKREVFDVRAWPGKSADPVLNPPNTNQQTEFAAAYLLLQLPKKLRFTAWLGAASRFGSGYAQNFPPFIGLTSFGDTDHTVSDAYLGWFNARGGNTPPPTVFPPAGLDDGRTDFPNDIDPFATAVAVILGAGQMEQAKLVSLLADLSAEFDMSRNDDLAIFDDNAPGELFDSSTYVTEPIRPSLNFMAALALAWFFSKTQSDAGTPLPSTLGFPIPPPAGTNLPQATIPKDVIKGSFGWPTAEQVIPIDGLPPLPNPLPNEVDLFAANAPLKPADPPPPFTVVKWLFSDATSHSGIFGAKGTDTINSGKVVVGSACAILGVKLQLVDKHGVPLGDSSTTTSLGRPDAVVGSWPSTAGAGILSVGTSATDETVTVHWWYDMGRACRYRLAYLVQGANCSL